MRVATLVFISWCVFSCAPPAPGELDAGSEPVADDAGVPADGGADAGPVDDDAGRPDAGAEADAGPADDDAGRPDAGGEADAGPANDDAGWPDAGGEADAGAADSGVTDAGAPDAGCVCSLPFFCNAQDVCAVDTIAPRLTATGAAGSAPGKVRVQGTADDPETGITSVEVRVNQGAPVALPVVMGLFDGELDSADTEFVIVVSGSDRAGNIASVQTTYDPSPPVISLQPDDAQCGAGGCTGAVISGATTVFTITATITDLALAATNPVRIRVVTQGGTELVPLSNMSSSGGTAWTWTWTNLPALDDTALDFVVTATDAAGNQGTGTVHGRIDRIAPTLTALPSQDASCDASGCVGGVISLATTGFSMTGTTSGAQLNLRVKDGAGVVVPTTPLPLDSTGAWSWTWASPPTVDGRFYGVELTATDVVGNAATLTRAVLVDRVLPSLFVSAPAAGALLGTPTVAVISSAADSLGVRTVEVAAQPSGPFTSASLDANGDYVATLPVPVVDAVTQTLAIRAVDLVGNTRALTRSYVADRVAPVVTVNGTDYDCSGAQCTGLVANGSSTSVTFSGTATDGSALSLSRTLVGTSPVATGTDPVTGGTWSWTWSNLPPNVNGAPFELRVVATDAAGNASAQAVRRVWLDNVAPTVTVPVAGQRNVSRTGTLLTFSEPMVVSSVVAGTSLTAAVPLSGFGSTDGRNFGFSTNVLANYVWYRLVSVGSRDRAGNPLSAPADAYFLSEPVARGALTIARSYPGATFRFPVLAVDSDQQLFVHYAATYPSGTYNEATILSGNGTAVSLFNMWNQATFVREGELRIVAEARGADQRLNPTIEHTLLAAGSQGTQVGFGTQTHTWGPSGLLPTFESTTWGPVIPTSLADIGRVRPTLDIRPYASGLRRGFVVPDSGANAMLSIEWSGSQWTSATSATLAGFQKMDGRASIENTATLGQNRIRYYDLRAMSEVGTAGFVRGATGQPMLKRVDSFFGVPVATSGAFMAWATDTQLTIACSPAPFAPVPVWRPTALAMPATTTMTGLTSTMDSTRVVFAAEFGGSVYVHSTPITGCAASPSVTQLAVLPGMKEPNVFIDASGRVWVAAISSAGDVVVHKL
ncbi:MAG: Ig-like domain repeat protein [Myxococcota bacterium]